MTAERDETSAILAQCDAGSISNAVALMRLLIATEDAAEVERLLRIRAAEFLCARGVLEMLTSNAGGVARIAAMLRSDVDRPPRNATAEEGIAFCRRLFDWSVRQSEEASVALYSLGDSSILEAATREIVAWLDAQGLLRDDRDAIDVGCGIGRMEVALAPRLRSIVGVDVSEEMVRRARARCAGLPNATLLSTTGKDLAAFDDASTDLVLAIDVFPYLVQSALVLAEKHVKEAARVLRPRGHLVIMNFSYRGDASHDLRDVNTFAKSYGFTVRAPGTSPFTLWDGQVYLLSRPR